MLFQTEMLLAGCRACYRALPGWWSDDECTSFRGDPRGPPESWLKSFWAEVESGIWEKKLSAAFSNVLVLSVEGDQLASPSACRKFNMLPADVDLTPEEKGVLARLGCLIAADARGRLVGVNSGGFPLLAALIGAAERKGCSLESLVACTADARVVRAALAHHLANSGWLMDRMGGISSSLQSKLGQLKIFESITGSFESINSLFFSAYLTTLHCALTPDWEASLETVAVPGALKGGCKILKVFGTGEDANERLTLLSAAGIGRNSSAAEFCNFLLMTVSKGIGREKIFWFSLVGRVITDTYYQNIAHVQTQQVYIEFLSSDFFNLQRVTFTFPVPLAGLINPCTRGQYSSYK